MNKQKHPARRSITLINILSILLIMFFLGACQSSGINRLSSSGENRALELANNARHEDAANIYISLAEDANRSKKERLVLLAIEQWLDAGNLSKAEQANINIQPLSNSSLTFISETNSAAFNLYRGNAEKALEILNPMSEKTLPLRDRLRVEMLRADAWIQKKNPARAIELMELREAWISDPDQIKTNRNRLWKGLLYSDPKILRNALDGEIDEQTRAWLNLGLLAASTGQQGIGWNNGLFRWRIANPSHPALTAIDEKKIFDDELLIYPKKIALILSLSGHTGKPGEAIKNGFFGAYFAAASVLDDQQSIQIYNIDFEGDASKAYQKAVSNGAEFIVGPLLKKNVNELINNTLISIPVLTLNYLLNDIPTPPNFYQFALAPEDEVLSTAKRVLGDGYNRAVALVPDNDWGRRVLQSFTIEFEDLGGSILDYQIYPLEKQDFSNEIEDLMGLSNSLNRYQRLRENIGNNLQFNPRRRQDAEIIFLAAAAGPGRLLKSQLKFHYSGDIPVYSTSSIYSLDGRSNADLNGIMFADIPWLIDPQPWVRYLPEIYSKNWPEEKRLSRLHAMGYDAYNLVTALFANQNNGMNELNGATGSLFLDQQGRIHRRLAWAQFQGGQTIALPNQEDIGGPIQDNSSFSKDINSTIKETFLND
ncbi:MAG: hypothetical protein CMQ54_04630 [Gammaproteobacteria bacterium]|nr:hypothetical protein [Gammaproteobacteria bacterium]|tara:strand:+ start:6812 stop:8767 length:1956 start_codon:yes stop_codon:yes gene_type:complete